MQGPRPGRAGQLHLDGAFGGRRADPDRQFTGQAGEAGHERRGRPGVDLLRGALLGQPATLEDADPVGQRERLGLVVGESTPRPTRSSMAAARSRAWARGSLRRRRANATLSRTVRSGHSA
jgi:hypothetical protein